MHSIVDRVTNRIFERSKTLRAGYLARMANAREQGTARTRLSCGNLAHGFAAMGTDKAALKARVKPNIGIEIGRAHV